MEPETRLARTRQLIPYIVPVLVALAACIPLARHQWFSSHELCAPAIRLHELHHVISETRRVLAPWLPDLAFGHGLPFFVFYAPLSTYIAEFAHLLGADLLQAVKVSFASSLVLSALSIAAFLSYLDRSRKLAAAPETIGLASAVYVIAPYRMADLYVRGSLAECWSFVFFPLILLGCHMLADGRRRSGLAIGSLSYAALVLSHNIMALYFSAVLCLYIVLVRDLRRAWPWAALMIILGQGLSAFFWVPALANMPLVGTDTATMWATAEDVASHAVYWHQFFSQRWKFGLSVPGPADGMSFAIGWPIVAGVILMPLVALDKNERAATRRLACVVLVVVALAVAAMTPVMRWHLVPAIFRYIQFPWRLLAFVTLFGTVAVFLALHALVRWSDLGDVAGRFPALFNSSVMLLILMLGAPTIRAVPITIGDVDRAYILERLEIEESAGVIGSTARAEYVPATAAPETIEPEWNEEHSNESHIEIVEGTARVKDWSRRGGRYTVDLDCETDITVAFQSYYFPGWQYRLDGERRDRDLKPGRYGFIRVTVPAGSHRLTFEYGSPPWGRVSAYISLVTLTGLLGWTALSRRGYGSERRGNLGRTAVHAPTSPLALGEGWGEGSEGGSSQLRCSEADSQ